MQVNNIIPLERQEIAMEEDMRGEKYEFIEEVISIGGKLLRRIRALKSFGSVKSGDIGGFIQHRANLSQFGDCWVADNACVYGNAMIVENAIIGGHARIRDHAVIGGEAYIGGTVEVGGSVRLNNRTWLINHVMVVEGR